jgi:hypothetical protein
MATLIFALITLQALGAVVGAVSAVWGEIAYITAMRDEKIDHAEMLHLRSIAAGLRVGSSFSYSPRSGSSSRHTSSIHGRSPL